ncbi:insulinase family protein [Candidatus Saccharibacteria bacterium]|nr:insulinase family protein [Candidatus Saccharibacteria bacterium]
MTTKQTTLPNGLRIVTTDLADALSVTANIFVGTGSRYENWDTNGGVSHFLEHLLFKGSAKYPTAEAINLAVDEVGGFNNAYTSEDVTTYYIKVPAAHGELALDILADMIKAPVLDPAEIDRERDVIIEEMNVWRDDPARFVATLMPELIFPDNPLGRDIIGSETIIRSVTPKTIRDYLVTHYRPGNLVVSVAGRVDHDAVVKQLTATLGELEAGETEPPQRVANGPSEVLSSAHVKETAQAHFIISSRAYAYDDNRDAAAKVMAAILGRGMSSRLFSTVRERLGLAYGIYADVSNYVDTGLFTLYAGVTIEKSEQAVTAVLAELEKIRLEPVSEAELAKAKRQLRSGLEMSLESNAAIADRLGAQLILLGRTKSLEDTLAELEAVTVAQVQAAAAEILAPAALRMAIIAPEPEAAVRTFETLVTKETV